MHLVRGVLTVGLLVFAPLIDVGSGSLLSTPASGRVTGQISFESLDGVGNRDCSICPPGKMSMGTCATWAEFHQK